MKKRKMMGRGNLNGGMEHGRGGARRTREETQEWVAGRRRRRKAGSRQKEKMKMMEEKVKELD